MRLLLERVKYYFVPLQRKVDPSRPWEENPGGQTEGTMTSCCRGGGAEAPWAAVNVWSPYLTLGFCSVLRERHRWDDGVRRLRPPHRHFWHLQEVWRLDARGRECQPPRLNLLPRDGLAGTLRSPTSLTSQLGVCRRWRRPVDPDRRRPFPI